MALLSGLELTLPAGGQEQRHLGQGDRVDLSTSRYPLRPDPGNVACLPGATCLLAARTAVYSRVERLAVRGREGHHAVIFQGHHH